jgi:hypothetical protein
VPSPIRRKKTKKQEAKKIAINFLNIIKKEIKKEEKNETKHKEEKAKKNKNWGKNMKTEK